MFAFLIGTLLMASWMAPESGVLGEGPTAEMAHRYYAEGNVAALRRLLHTSEDRTIRLLCRYRLYPLTEDAKYLVDLPETLEAPSARELALLSGLWGYRVREAPVWRVPSYGRRSQRLMDEAKHLNATDPYVLLIEGQSLLFRPALFGGDPRNALDCFRRLQQVLSGAPDVGISMMEAMLWEWYALEKMDDQAADDVREHLLAQNLPPVYRQFLQTPP